MTTGAQKNDHAIRAWSLHVPTASRGLGRLLFLFDVDGVLAKSWRKLFEFKLLAATFLTNGVVVITCLFANEMEDFQFFLTFACHG